MARLHDIGLGLTQTEVDDVLSKLCDPKLPAFCVQKAPTPGASTPGLSPGVNTTPPPGGTPLPGSTGPSAAELERQKKAAADAAAKAEAERYAREAALRQAQEEAERLAKEAADRAQKEKQMTEKKDEGLVARVLVGAGGGFLVGGPPGALIGAAALALFGKPKAAAAPAKPAVGQSSSVLIEGKPPDQQIVVTQDAPAGRTPMALNPAIIGMRTPLVAAALAPVPESVPAPTQATAPTGTQVRSPDMASARLNVRLSQVPTSLFVEPINVK